MNSLRCPHCLDKVFVHYKSMYIGQDTEAHWQVQIAICPSCKRLIVFLENGKLPKTSAFEGATVLSDSKWQLVKPRGHNRPPCPQEVPSHIAEDYTEACQVLSDSPKAAAALSRRCLQNLLREKANIKAGNLVDEIQQIIDSRQLPSHLVKAIDSVRNIGNFAAHPIKSKSTGTIVAVEAGEAEWNLDVLEGLFDFYCVQPEIVKKKKEALNKKLKDAGKPPMK